MLTDTQIRALKPKEQKYRKLDFDRLYIEVRPTGLKSWVFKYTLDGKESMLKLGEYPYVELKKARELADVVRGQILNGINPKQQRDEEKTKAQAEKANTFKVVAEEWVEKKLIGRSKTYVDAVNRSLKKDIYPVIGKKPTKEITAADVLSILNNTISRVKSQKNHGTGEATAINNRQIISAVMNYAVATLRADNDPTYAVRHSIERPQVNHATPITKEQIKKLKDALADYGGTSTVKNAINLLFYTMLRTVEVRRLKWDFVNFNEKTITLPARSREEIIDGKRVMKKNRTHIVPLSEQALNILKSQLEVSGMQELVFPSPFKSNQMLSASTINKAFDYLNMSDITAHDFRATASTVLNEFNYDSDWIEIQLAHSSDDKTRATYNHAKYMNGRVGMMQWWADYLDGCVN